MNGKLRGAFLAFLADRKGATWLSAAAGLVLLILGIPILAAELVGNRDDMPVRIAGMGDLPWTDAERALVRGLALSRAPLAPPPPPAQVAPPFRAGVLSLPPDSARRQAFVAATRLLRGLDGADPAGSPRIDALGCPEADLRAEAMALLPAADAEGDSRAGMINYHLGVTALCAGDAAGAAGHFAAAEAPLARAAARLGTASPRRRYLAQYEVARLYGHALAHAGWPAADALDPEAARAADERLLAAYLRAHADGVVDAPRYGAAGAYRDFGVAGRPGDPVLFAFSSADILAARLWLLLRSPSLLSYPPAGLEAWLAAAARDAETVRRPALAANAVVVALALDGSGARDPRETVRQLHRLHAGLPAEQRLAVQAERRLRAMAALAGADLAGVAGADQFAEEPEPSRWRRACTRDGMDYPPLVVAPAGEGSADPDALVLDRYLCILHMRKALWRGDPEAMVAAHAALRDTPGGLDFGIGAVARAVAAPAAGRLVAEVARKRREGDAVAARALDRVLVEEGLFAGSTRLAARMRLWFGPAWLLFCGLALAGLAACLWAHRKGAAIRRALAALESPGHRRDRLGDGAQGVTPGAQRP